MKTDRMMGIVMVLLEKKRVSAKYLADLFEVSPRTIYRDIESIGMAGIPVRAMPGVGGGIEIMPGYKLDKSVFTSENLSVLLTSLQVLSGLAESGDLAGTAAKVRSLIPAGQSQEVALRADWIRVDASPWFANPDEVERLRELQRALREQIPVAVTYVSGRGVKTQRVVEPHRLVLKGSRWYVHAYCRLRREFRLFKLVRMLDLRFEEERFELREGEEQPDLQLDASEAVRDLQVEVTLRVHRSIADRLLDHCSFKCFEPDGPEHFQVRMPLVPNDYFVDVLLGLGPQCEVLEPAEVREAVRERAQRVAALYA